MTQYLGNMTISQALISLNTFPIPDLFIDKVGIERGLVITDDYTLEIGQSKSFELATADVYMYLYTQLSSLKEQEVSFGQDAATKENFFSLANAIYAKYGDPKFSGINYGFIGENFNG